MNSETMHAWLRKQAYDPSLVGVFVNPFFLARRGLAKAMRALGRSLEGRLIDVGCGFKPYQDFVGATEYVGVEIDTPESRRTKRADFFYDGKRLPFDDASFDSALCSQVLEHVFEPDVFLEELKRVLRPNGLVLLSTPFAWDEHEQPFDYARYSSFGLKYLLEKHGFLIIEARKTLADVSMLFQLANAYVYKITHTRSRWVNLAVTATIMAPLSLVGMVLGRVLPKNADLYLDNVLLFRKAG